MGDPARIPQTLLCSILSALALAAVPAPAAAAYPSEAALAEGIAALRLPPPHRLRGKARRDPDGDGLSSWTEFRRTRTNPRRRDTDRDRLADGVEVRRTRTNPRRRDTDRDGLDDWRELRRTGTEPRRADSDGDGVLDGAEVLAGSDPQDPASVPGLLSPLPPPPLLPIPIASPTGSPAEEEEPPPPAPETAPPETTIDSGPAALVSSDEATFEFSGEDGIGSGVASFECRLDEASFAECVSGVELTGLSDGDHEFAVRAIDGVGNVDASPAVHQWMVDTTPPGLSIDSGPSGLSNDPLPAFAFSAESGATVQCSVDVGAPSFGACSASDSHSPASPLSDGPHTLRLRATDSAGNQAMATRGFTVDATAPDTQIDSGPPTLTNADEATFEFSGGDGGGSGVASFECRLDGGGFASCGSGIGLTGLGDGDHEFAVRVIDEAGNVDGSPAVHQWHVDRTPPQPTIDSLSKVLLKSGETSTVSWHAGENGTFQLRVGGTDCDTGSAIASGAYASAPEPAISSVSADKLAEGTNTLRLCLVDAAGNRGATTAALTKDTTTPDTQIAAEPEPFTQSTTASFAFTGVDPDGSGVASFECSWNNSPWATCTSPRELNELAEGPHEFEVRAVDDAGNIDPIPASVNWAVDNTPPIPSIDSGPDGLTNDPSPTFRFSSEPGASFECSIDGGSPSFGPCSADALHTPPSPLTDGAHTFRLRATDAAGNQATARRDFEVDTTAPPAPSLNPTAPISPANENEPLLTGTAPSDTTVRLYAGGACGGAPIATVDPAELEAGVRLSVLDDSTTVFRATASTAERTSGCSEPISYVEDSTAPETTLAPSPPATTYSTSASFFFAASEPGTSFECKLDGSAFTACASPRSYADLPPGGHSFTVRATDAAGNVELAFASSTWAVKPPSTPPSACATGGTQATDAAAVRTTVQEGEDACVVAHVGDVDLARLDARPQVISTAVGGSMGDVDLSSTRDLTIAHARLRAITLRGSHRVALLGNTIGGTQAERVLDQLIFMPETNNDVRIEGNDIGWTRADNSGNTGYGCRCYGTLNRLRFVGNRVHDIAADGFQGVGGSNVLIDRNEIGPVGRNPGSSEHSDNIQITGNGDNLRITNNWLHHQGYYEGSPTANAGSTYIHGGDSSSLLYENNLIETAQGRTEICGLGTGGSSRSNIAIRRNTWVDGGRAFTGFPGFEWDCDAGEGNTITRNIAIDADGGFLDNGYDAAIVAPNLFGEPSLVTLDGDGNCTSANCKPATEEPIGYRQPSGVSW